MIGYVSLEALVTNPGHYTVVLNRRKHVKVAFVKERLTPWTPLSHRGESFMQHLASGQVWSLRGVRGSEKAEAAVA